MLAGRRLRRTSASVIAHMFCMVLNMLTQYPLRPLRLLLRLLLRPLQAIAQDHATSDAIYKRVKVLHVYIHMYIYVHIKTKRA